MDFNLISKMISPSKGLEMIKAGIEKNLGRSVDHFQIDYIAAKKDLSFKVWITPEKTIRESWRGANKEMLIFMIESAIKAKISDGKTLDVCTCEYLSDKTLNLVAYITDKEGNKIKEELTHKL